MIDYKELEPPVHRPDSLLPKVSTARAAYGFRGTIERVVKTINYAIRFGQWETRDPRHLFTMVGGEEFSDIRIPNYPARETFSGRIDAQTGQEVLFEVMTGFGLDTSESTKHSSHHGSTSPYLVNVHNEIISYPSQTVPGLEFDRIVGYNDWPRNSRVVFVTWQVADRAPEYAINWRRLFPPLSRLLAATS